MSKFGKNKGKNNRYMEMLIECICPYTYRAIQVERFQKFIFVLVPEKVKSSIAKLYLNSAKVKNHRTLISDLI